MNLIHLKKRADLCTEKIYQKILLMFTSCRITEYCFKCGIANVLVAYIDSKLKQKYTCTNCLHINPISVKNQLFIKNYKWKK